MKTITLEEHFVTESFLKATGAYGNNAPPQLALIQPKLLDLGSERIAAMDQTGIDLQVMSLAAIGIDKLEPSDATAVMTDVNSELSVSQPPLKCAVEVVGIDRILFSLDYPFSPNTYGRKFLEDAAGWLGDAEMEKLKGGNAQGLLKL
jgi:Amidohydrolase